MNNSLRLRCLMSLLWRRGRSPSPRATTQPGLHPDLFSLSSPSSPYQAKAIPVISHHPALILTGSFMQSQSHTLSRSSMHRVVPPWQQPFASNQKCFLTLFPFRVLLEKRTQVWFLRTHIRRNFPICSESNGTLTFSSLSQKTFLGLYFLFSFFTDPVHLSLIFFILQLRLQLCLVCMIPPPFGLLYVIHWFEEHHRTVFFSIRGGSERGRGSGGVSWRMG